MKNIILIITIVVSVLIIGSCKEGVTESVITNPKPDTTTHNIIWEEIDLEYYRGYIEGVWGFDENNIYVGGFFWLRDSIYTNYNYFHFDGNTFTPLPGGIGSAMKMHGNNNIIVAPFDQGTKVEIITKDGVITSFPDEMDESTYYLNAWVSETDKAYLIGNKVTLNVGDERSLYNAHLYEAGNVTELSVNPSFIEYGSYVHDIMGFSDTLVYATAYSIHGVDNTFFKYDGYSWNKLQTWHADLDNGIAYSIEALWGTSPDSMYFGGNKLLFGSIENNEEILPPDGESFGWINDIYGTGKNNVFVCGNNSSLMHYSGKTWKRIENLPGNGGYELHQIWCNDKIIAIAGIIRNSFIPTPILIIGRYAE